MTATTYLSAQRRITPVADGDLDECMTRWVNHIAVARDARRTVHLIGNGGSASIAAHAQNDLVKGCGVKALIYQDVPLLTALENDDGYHQGYAAPLALWIEPDDVLIAISSSGASGNILQAVRVAKAAGATIVTCSGFNQDNPLRQLGDLNFYVPSFTYGYVELTHAALLHCLTDRLAHAR